MMLRVSSVILLLIGLSSFPAVGFPQGRGPSTGALEHKVVSRAHQLIGTPYRWGGSSVAGGFDCSGLMVYLFGTEAGIKLPRTATSIFRSSKQTIARKDLKRGDAVFFKHNKRKPISHVGVYIGNGHFIHAPSKGKFTRIDSLNNGYWSERYVAGKRLY